MNANVGMPLWCLGIVTEDSDCWLYGARRIYKHVFLQSNTKDVVFYTSDAFGALERSFLLEEEALDESVHGDSASSTTTRAAYGFEYNCSRCGRSLALNRAELVFLAMLTGSDYTRGVPHVGATTARLLLRRFLRPRIRALEHSAAFCSVCNFDAAGTRALPQDQPVAPLSPADLVLDALRDFRYNVRIYSYFYKYTNKSSLNMTFSNMFVYNVCYK